MSGTRRHNERNPGPCGPSVTDPHIQDVGGGKSPAICPEESRAVFCMWCEDHGDCCKDTGAVGDGRTRNGARWEGIWVEPGGRVSEWRQPESSQLSAEHRGVSWSPRRRSLEGARGVRPVLRNEESHNRARCVSPSSLDPFPPHAKAPGYLLLGSWAVLAAPTTSLLLSTYNT